MEVGSCDGVFVNLGIGVSVRELDSGAMLGTTVFGFSVGAAVGPDVGEGVGPGVGSTLGIEVSDTGGPGLTTPSVEIGVGISVGDRVFGFFGFRVGTAVGPDVGTPVGS